MKDKKKVDLSKTVPDERSRKIASIVAMIDYLAIELRKTSPITAFILDMASQSLFQEAFVNSSHNGRDTTEQQ